MDAIYKRRSIRSYTKDPVKEEDILAIIKAGMNAPSAGNQQPWQFVVINKREVLDKIPEVHPHSKMILEAPAAILVCGDLSLERHIGYWVQDCSAAVENMLLEIADRNLGGVWLGVYPREERMDGIKKMFKLPDNFVPFAIVVVGHAAESKENKNEFKPERIRYNSWE